MVTISCPNRSEASDRRFEKIWFGFLLAVLMFLAILGSDSIIGYLGIVLLIDVGAIAFYLTRWSVVDEAVDCGDSLRFRKGSITYDVPLAEIREIGHPFANFKGLITVKTSRPIQSRRRFTFLAAPTADSFKAPPIFGELEQRIGFSR